MISLTNKMINVCVNVSTLCILHKIYKYKHVFVPPIIGVVSLKTYYLEILGLLHSDT